jgi:hypothetical protein
VKGVFVGVGKIAWFGSSTIKTLTDPLVMSSRPALLNVGKGIKSSSWQKLILVIAFEPITQYSDGPDWVYGTALHCIGFFFC